MNKHAICSLTVLVSITLDQLTKYIANRYLLAHEPISLFGDTFRLLHSVNHGAFLSLGSNLPENVRNFIFTVLVGIFLAGFTFYTLRDKNMRTLQLVACSLVISGGFSNLYDRATNNGGVVDFLNIGLGNLRTGIFNVADVAIMAGVLLLICYPNKKQVKDEVPEQLTRK